MQDSPILNCLYISPFPLQHEILLCLQPTALLVIFQQKFLPVSNALLDSSDICVSWFLFPQFTNFMFSNKYALSTILFIYYGEINMAQMTNLEVLSF